MSIASVAIISATNDDPLLASVRRIPRYIAAEPSEPTMNAIGTELYGLNPCSRKSENAVYIPTVTNEP